jgi:hypothetical protein
VGRRTRRDEGKGYALRFLRAGFEPCRGFDQRPRFMAVQCFSNENILKQPRERSGSKPARRYLNGEQHARRAEFFAPPHAGPDSSLRRTPRVIAFTRSVTTTESWQSLRRIPAGDVLLEMLDRRGLGRNHPFERVANR